MGIVDFFKNFVRRSKRLIWIILGRDFYSRLDLNCPRERLGSEYGGWSIAKGKLRKNSIIYSFGLGEDISFDLELIKQYGVIVHGFDPTPKSVQWIHAQSLPEKFIFHEYGISDFDGFLTFYAPANPNHASFSMIKESSNAKKSVEARVKKLATIMLEFGHEKIDLLKMDIEGAEYSVIGDLAASGIKPDQILVEFHHRFSGVNLRKTKEAVDKLRAMGYGLYSVSPNGEEYSFILMKNQAKT